MSEEIPTVSNDKSIFEKVEELNISDAPGNLILNNNHHILNLIIHFKNLIMLNRRMQKKE